MASYIRDFRVLGELGAGQYGRVFHAVGIVPSRTGQPGRRRSVAIKVLRKGVPDSAFAALEQEWRLLAQVKHRAVLQVLDFWPEERAIVMEYVHGVTLRQVLDTCRAKKEPIYTEAAVDIACELADALYQANTTRGENGEALNLVHRDLKPENVILTPGGEVRVLDFGLATAKNRDFRQERDGLVRGTPLYMAPEQLRGDGVDHRSDLHALGLILFELLTGRPAWAPDTELGLIAAGETGAACREVESLVPGVGALVSRLLQASPRARYATGQDVLVDLRRHLYRERGTGLSEFCDYFFGTLYSLPEPASDPEPDMPAPNASPAPDASSAEEGVQRAVPVRRSGRAVPLAASSATPVAPADSAPRAAPRIVQRPTPQRGADEDVMPASVRASSGGPPRQKVVGARRPDETGMLSVIPLNEAMEKGAQQDQGATGFFAIPAPKVARPGPVSSPASTPAGAFQPPQVGSAPPVAYTNGNAPGGPAAVAGYGNAPGSPNAGTPFAVAGAAPVGGSSAETRVQSQRVWAVILGVAFLAFMAVLAVVAIVLWTQLNKDPEVPKAPEQPVAAVVATTPPEEAVDQEPPQAPPSRPRQGGGSKTPTRPAEPAAPPPAALASVTVTFTGTHLPSSATLTCGDSKLRATVSGGRVSFAQVPTSEDCILRPAGALTYSPARNIRGGKNYTCDVSTFDPICR